MEQVKKGRAQLLMNGYVSSNHMLKAAMDPKKGIRTGEVFSQLTAIELPSFPKLLFVTDTGIQVRAGAREKRSSLANSLGYLKNLGAEEIRVALLRGIPMTEFNGTKDYTQRILAEEMALLENMKEDYPGLILLGPTSLEESMKGEVPDLFLAPNVEAGQVLSHALCAFAGGKAGHIILGGQVPLVLTDDNQTEENLWRSILMALACM
jgi:phosphotransacetylase